MHFSAKPRTLSVTWQQKQMTEHKSQHSSSYSLGFQEGGHVEHNELEAREFELLSVIHGGKLQQLCSVLQCH